MTCKYFNKGNGISCIVFDNELQILYISSSVVLWFLKF